MHSFGKSKKIFEYKAIIISLYGIIEKYIGIWIQEHIDTLPNIIKNYNDLPSTLRKNNFDLSIKLISLINENNLFANLVTAPQPHAKLVQLKFQPLA